MKTATLGQIIHSFFIDYLGLQKGLQATSVQCYRDVIKLLLCFMAGYCRRKVSRLTIGDFSLELIQEFLNHLEHERGNHIRTRNHRLAVLHTFFEYVARRAPETHFLNPEQVADLFRRLPRHGPHALRDHTLLLFLYNTGARVQEVAELKVSQLDLSGQGRVRLHGKGDKWRVCPLWNDTINRLQQLLQQHGSSDADDSVFLSARSTALTRFGIYKIVRRHCQYLEENGFRPGSHISPHTFRHTAAVHLLESGVEVNVIRGWLGHVKLDTTNRYAEITLKSKEAALRACEPADPMRSESLPRTVWRDDKQLLNWLDSL